MDNYAVIGNPIHHSQSPFIHTAFAQQTTQNMVYVAMQAPLGGFLQTIKEFEAAGGKGCNVTLPFKEQAAAIATELSPLAKQTGVANTLIFRPNNEIYADNTDGPGLIRDLKNNSYQLEQQQILILGAGGSAKAITASLLSEKPAQVWISNRTRQKAVDIAQQFNQYGPISGCSLDEIPKTPFHLIINATSASLKGELPKIPAEAVNQETWCYDLFYNQAAPTVFLAWGKQQGCKHCLDGIGMLVEQAALSFELWRGIHPNTKPVVELLRA